MEVYMTAASVDLKSPPKVSRFAKFALGMQVFLLRRGWMGNASDIIMVITTTGRKTGRKRTIPIGYKRDGENFFAINKGNSHWFRNVQANDEAVIEIKGEAMKVQGAVVTDEQERQRIFGVYTQDPATFRQLFRLPADTPEGELQNVLSEWKFIRFEKIK
jgi:deazaflavin-dependent oxidoreductase (nitroreductase family)